MLIFNGVIGFLCTINKAQCALFCLIGINMKFSRSLAFILSISFAPMVGAASYPEIPLKYELKCDPKELESVALSQSGIPSPFWLLDKAREGKEIQFPEGASLAGLDAILQRYYGMNKSLRTMVTDPVQFAIISRIAVLIQNNYAVAAQMALGASIADGRGDKYTLHYIRKYVEPIYEPYDGEPELTLLAKNFESAMKEVRGISPKPLAFARWGIRAAIYDDYLALDAARIGFCASNPSDMDSKKFSEIFKKYRSNPKMNFPNPSVSAGAAGAPDFFRK